MAVRTQGTHLYIVRENGTEVLPVGCITSLDGIAAPRSNIDTTCLGDQDRTFEPGMREPGTASFSINTDPTDESHNLLHELYRSGEMVRFAVGWADGEDAPTTAANGDFDDLPETRSWITFSGYVSDYPYSFTQNAVVTSNISVQISGEIVPIPRDVSTEG